MTESDVRMTSAVLRRVCQLLPHESHFWFPLPPFLPPREMCKPEAIVGHTGMIAAELQRTSPWDQNLVGAPLDRSKATHIDLVKATELCRQAQTLSELRTALSTCEQACDWLKAQTSDVALNLIHIQTLIHHIFAGGAVPVPPPEAATVFFASPDEQKAYTVANSTLPWANITSYDDAAAVGEHLVQLICEMAAASASLPFSLEMQALDQVSTGAALSMLDALLMAPCGDASVSDMVTPAIIMAGYRELNLFCTASSGASFAATTASCPFTSPEALGVRVKVQHYFSKASCRHSEKPTLFDWSLGCPEDIDEAADFVALHIAGQHPSRDFFYNAAELAGLNPKCRETDNREDGTTPVLMAERIKFYQQFKDAGFQYTTDMEKMHLPKHAEMGFKMYWTCGTKEQNQLFTKDPLSLCFRDLHFLFRILMEPHHDNIATGRRYTAAQARPMVHVMGSNGDTLTQGINVQVRFCLLLLHNAAWCIRLSIVARSLEGLPKSACRAFFIHC